jgi:hypothetical protein
MQQQDGEQRPLARSSDPQQFGPVAYFERPQDSELQ